MKFSEHPIWLVGFRPFFALACLSGLSLPVLWALVYSGILQAPASSFSPLQWHAHEMFFGFGWAVLGGFLLTATKNWTKVRGYHGSALMFLVAAWLVERLGMWFGGAWPAPLFLVSNYLFLGSMVALLLWTLIRYRHQDDYRDNLLFIVFLPGFIAAKYLLLSDGHFQLGWGIALGLFRMAFLVMLERTLSQFMKGAFQVAILRDARLDTPIKLLALLLVVAETMPPWLAAGAAALLALLLALRLLYWKPQLAVRRLEIAVMYLGYLGIVAQLLVEAADRVVHPLWIGAVSVHLFTFGVMGLIIPAMLIRISKGHTGRKVLFDAMDKLVLVIMILAVAVRIVAPQLAPGAYLTWIGLSAACWFASFSLLAWRYIPLLVRPRVDGREH